MVQNPPCWRASCQLGHPEQSDFIKTNLHFFSLFWMSQCVACSPAWWILYHVINSCKGPIPLLIFSFVLHRHVSENVQFKRKIQRFVAPNRSKMISLQDFPCLYGWYSCFRFIACVLVFSLFLSLSLSFYVCGHSQRVDEFIACFKIYVCFLKSSWPCSFPQKT